MRSLPRWRKDLEAQTRQPDEIIIVGSTALRAVKHGVRTINNL
jgi:hypothetical protein